MLKNWDKAHCWAAVQHWTAQPATLHIVKNSTFQMLKIKSQAFHENIWHSWHSFHYSSEGKRNFCLETQSFVKLKYKSRTTAWHTFHILFDLSWKFVIEKPTLHLDVSLNVSALENLKNNVSKANNLVNFESIFFLRFITKYLWRLRSVYQNTKMNCETDYSNEIWQRM